MPGDFSYCNFYTFTLFKSFAFNPFRAGRDKNFCEVCSNEFIRYPIASISCKDADTQRILQEIIRETTNKLNRIQKQESENEVKLRQIEGEIEAATMTMKLLETRHENVTRTSEMEGEAEALRVKTFFDGLGQNLTTSEKLTIFNTLRKNDALTTLSSGTAQLYFTPADVDLSIESKQ